jgi:hypothetical protein
VYAAFDSVYGSRRDDPALEELLTVQCQLACAGDSVAVSDSVVERLGLDATPIVRQERLDHEVERAHDDALKCARLQLVEPIDRYVDARVGCGDGTLDVPVAVGLGSGGDRRVHERRPEQGEDEQDHQRHRQRDALL